MLRLLMYITTIDGCASKLEAFEEFKKLPTYKPTYLYLISKRNKAWDIQQIVEVVEFS